MTNSKRTEGLPHFVERDQNNDKFQFAPASPMFCLFQLVMQSLTMSKMFKIRLFKMECTFSICLILLFVKIYFHLYNYWRVLGAIGACETRRIFAPFDAISMATGSSIRLNFEPATISVHCFYF